jgi:hypothetical protein
MPTVKSRPDRSRYDTSKERTGRTIRNQRKQRESDIPREELRNADPWSIPEFKEIPGIPYRLESLPRIPLRGR